MSHYSIIAKNTVSVRMSLFFYEEGGEVGYFNELQWACIERKVAILSIYARPVQTVI